MTARPTARPSFARLCSIVALAAGGAGSIGAADAADANVGRYRFATGTSVVGDAVAQYATDGKVGPENRWVTGTRGRHRLNIFFERPTEIGTVHVYSGGDRDGPAADIEVQYLDAGGVLRAAPGGSVSGNTDWFRAIDLTSPVTTTQLQILVDDQTATIQEVAAFPPLAAAPGLGDGVNVHLARQHRLPLTEASSTAGGSSRRAVVDGFVNDDGYWQSNGAANEWISLDLRDPPETDPPTVRWSTTPIEVGSVHLYSGLASGGQPPVSRGRFQTLDEASGLWVDIPGGSFNNNTETELSLVFDAPVTTAAMRLVVQSGPGVVREIVPLPPNGGQGWPLGTSVIEGPATDALAFGDTYYGLRLAGQGVSLSSGGDGSVEMRSPNTLIGQQYQVLLSVGTDTYRIRNRMTGLCLEPAGGSLALGAAVVESVYTGLPSQRWRMVDGAGGVAFENGASGLVLTATQDGGAWSLDQAQPGAGEQAWTLEPITHATKKGTGGFPDYSAQFGNQWAYNWGPNDTFPADVHFWPMQWGSFFWGQRPALVPEWQRNGEPIVLMGYNEPDRPDQSNMPVSTSVGMWPRLEVQGLPLLGPAVAGHPATSPYIQDFMAQATAAEMRIDYVGMHSYGGPNPDSFMNQINAAANAWGRDVVVSEFSVVDWNNTNNWTDDPVYNWFAEVLWRMENNDRLHRYAVFIFTDDPANPISDNRGEMLNADGTLTPEGKMYAAWDGDTQIRTDTPYHLHNEATYRRIGAVPGLTGLGSTTLGTRLDDGAAFEWRLVPGSAADLVRLESVADGRTLAFTARGLELLEATEGGGGVDEFRLDEIEHGWFALTEPTLNRRLRSGGGGSIDLAPAGTTSTNVRWRFVPVFGGVPGPPRDVQAIDLGGGEVLIGWDEHGFRDLAGFSVFRQGPDGGAAEMVAAGVAGESFVDMVPEPGTYVYSVSAVGDTGESPLASAGPVAVETCPADFNADFAVDAGDVSAAVAAIGDGLDYNGDGAADFFDVIDFLRVHDAGCEAN